MARFVLAAALLAMVCTPVVAQERVPLAQIEHVHGMAIDKNAPTHLLLATHTGIFRVTPDGMARRISKSRDDFMGFTAHPTEAKVFFGSGHPATGGNLGFIRSDDGGVTWKKVSAGVNGPVDFHAMDVSRGNPQILYGLFGGVQKSTDGGATWTYVGPGPEGATDIAVGAKDPNLLYGATKVGLAVSRDGGKSWELNIRRPVTMVDMAADGTLHAYVHGVGLVRTTEGTLQWQTLGKLADDTAIMQFAANAGVAYAVDHLGRLYKSTDEGRNFAPFPTKK